MPERGVHAVVALEQQDAAESVRIAVQADRAGFGGVVITDRFQPWLPRQGNAPFVWAVAGAIGQVTTGDVTVSAVPGYRMHPAVVAQSSATLAALFPGRHRLLLSAGDAIDEHVVAPYWPESHERAARVFESADVIRKFFSASGKRSDTRHAGEHFRAETSRLWGMPPAAPSVQIWAGGPVTARRAGRSTDGIVVQADAPERLRTLLDAMRAGAEEAGRSRDGLRATVHAQLSWAETEDEAISRALEEWPMAGLRFPRGDIRSPFDVDRLVRSVSVDDIRSRIPVTSDPNIVRSYLQGLLDLGFDVHVHNVGQNHAAWYDVAQSEILPKLVR